MYKTEIKESEIEEYITVCPYCMEKQSGFSCCGENHFSEAVLTYDDCYLLDEIDIIEDVINKDDLKGDMQLKMEKEGDL